MSVAGILGSSLFAGLGSSGAQNKFQQIQQGFQQLGQDLQSGNLPQAQSEFATLEQLLPSQLQTSATSTQSGTQTGNPVAQALSQLGQDLSSGNLSAAQSDFSTLQQDLQQQQSTNSIHPHHHHGGGGSQTSGQQSQQNSIATLFGTLGQDLQSGNLTAAQQTYSTLQQDFLQFAGGSGSSGSGGSTSTGSSLNVSA
jgi:outer membrane protein assembly factor BamD (BamD/ComL family)